LKALQLIAHGTPGKFELRDVPDPVPLHTTSSFKSKAAVSITSISGPNPPAYPSRSNFRAHSAAKLRARVVAAGSGVKNWHPGDEVAVQSNLFAVNVNSAGEAMNPSASSASFSVSIATAVSPKKSLSPPVLSSASPKAWISTLQPP